MADPSMRLPRPGDRVQRIPLKTALALARRHKNRLYASEYYREYYRRARARQGDA